MIKCKLAGERGGVQSSPASEDGESEESEAVAAVCIYAHVLYKIYIKKKVLFVENRFVWVAATAAEAHTHTTRGEQTTDGLARELSGPPDKAPEKRI